MPIVIFLLIIIIIILCPAILGIAAAAVVAALSMLSKLVIPLCIIAGFALVLTAIERRQGDNAPKWIRTTCAIIEIILIIFAWGMLHISGAYFIADLFYICAIGTMIAVYSEKDPKIYTVFKYAFIYGLVYIYFFEAGGLFFDMPWNQEYRHYFNEDFFDKPGYLLTAFVLFPILIAAISIPLSLIAGFACWAFRIGYDKTIIIERIKTSVSFVMNNKYTFIVSLLIALAALFFKYQIQTGGFICGIMVRLCT